MISGRDGDGEVDAGAIVATWDPHTHPIVAEVAGKLKFQDFVDGVTVEEKIDEITGLSSIVVMDPKQRSAAPARTCGPHARLVDAKDKEICFPNTDIPAVYALPPGAIVVMGDSVGRQGRRRDRTYPAGELEDP